MQCQNIDTSYFDTHIVTQEAGIPRKLAPTIGICVDPRRQNLSEESLAANVERLKAYKGRLVLFPRKIKSPKTGEASAEDMKSHRESGHEGKVKRNHTAFPISNKVTPQEGKVADYESEPAAYRKLRDARSEARLVGVREKRAKAKEEEAAAQKK
jgi:large subunit ribosomal protein L13e